VYEILADTKGKADPASPCDFESIWIVMEYVNGSTLEKFLKRKLIPVRNGHSRTVATTNEKILIDVLIQLAVYLKILQEKVRFNHRDLKINNLFVRHHALDEHWKQTLSIPVIGDWECIHDIVLLDFGFSCIACGSGFDNPRATLVGAGSWFKSEHDCLKYGRDLGQFLYSLHCTFPLQDYVSPTFFDLLHKSMFAIRGEEKEKIDLLMGFGDDGSPLGGSALPRSVKFNDGIYIFLRDSTVDIPGCNPSVFLKALSLYIEQQND
jgi:serine/threonine protein kinase